MKTFAHRGASGYAPENTIAAIKEAIRHGVDMIEFDVHVLPSGEVILIHDHRVDRTTDGLGYIFHHTFANLRLLNAGEDERIPTLHEALDLIDRQVRVDIELKGPDTARAVVKVIKEYLRRGWQTSDFLVSSFNHHELKEFKALMPSIDIAAIMDAVPLDYASYGQTLGAVAICPSDGFVNKAYVEDAHKRGLDVYVWTINHADEVERMRELGVDGIFTNFPDITQEADEPFQIEGPVGAAA